MRVLHLVALVAMLVAITPAVRAEQADSSLAEAIQLDSAASEAYERGEYDSALHYWRRASQIYAHSLGPKHLDVAKTFNNIGKVHWYLGNYNQALDYWKRTLSIRIESLGDSHTDVAGSYYNIALVYNQLCDYHLALNYFERALFIWICTYGEKHPRIAATYNNMAVSYQYGGDFMLALDYYHKALSIYIDVLGESNAHVAGIYNNLSTLYIQRGELTTALNFCDKALLIYNGDSESKRRDVEMSYINTGNIYCLQGNFDSALVLISDALSTLRSISGRGEWDPDVATAYNCLGEVYRAQRNTAKATDCYTKALIIWRHASERHQGVAVVCDNLAWVSVISGDTVSAIAYFHQSLDAVTIGQNSWRGNSLTLRALPEIPQYLLSLSTIEFSDTSRSSRERLFTALKTAEAGLDVLSRMKSTLSKESRLFFEEKYFELPGWVLYLQHELEKIGEPVNTTTTLRASEMASSVSFMEMMAEARLSTAGALSDALASEELNLLARIKWLDGHASDTRLDVERAAIEDTWTAFVDRLHREQPRYAALKYPRPATLEQTRAALAPDEVAIEYVLGKYGAFLVAVSKDSFAFHVLGSEPAVATCIAAADSEISGRTRGARFSTASVGPTEALYRLLLGPVESIIRGKRLIIVPSGDLEGISFEALRTPNGKFLVEEHSVEYAPSLAILALTRQWAKENPAESRKLLALGDPVYDRADSRATLRASSYSDTIRAGWTRLPGTESEVRAIEGLFPSSDRRVLMQLNATEANVEGEDWRNFGYLHFACHGALEAGPGRQPALVLSQIGNREPFDGFLTLSEVISRPHRARLSVLSACNSGRAGANQARTGVSSLARAFLLTGSDAVIVSLWPVDDEATAKLMTLLYKGMREENLRPGEALRRAQTALRNDSQHPEWQQPAYWAPFICVGE